MAMMKENKGKEVVDEAMKQGVQSQSRPPIGEKRKNISSRVDLGDLPSRHGREKKHKSTILPSPITHPITRPAILPSPPQDES